MNQEERRNRVICNRCRSTFDIADTVKIKKKLYSIEINERVCPICGGTFRAIEVPGDLDQFLYVNDDDRFYCYKDKRKN